MARLDVELNSLLIKKSLHEQNPAEIAYWVDPDLKFQVGVHYKDDIEVLKSLGFEVTGVTGTVAFGTTNLSTLEKLAKHPNVISIEQIMRDYITLDDSIPDIEADQVWTRNNDLFTGYTGKDVIVGIIDSGIDFKHLSFRKGGSTRILKIWDQTIVAPVNPPQGGETIPGPINSPASLVTPLGYGVEYDAGQINGTIGGDTVVRQVDDNGHGTHVAGIAAGNGKQAGGCHGEHHYIGVAPDADLIIVKRWGLTDGDRGEKMTPPAKPPINAPSNDIVGDAIKYILNEARKLSKPVVINCSFGSFSELMDGTDPISISVNTLLTANSTGTSIVFAAGNDGDARFHSNGTVPSSASPPLVLNLYIYAEDDKTRSLAILYPGANIDVRVISPVGGANGTVGWVASGATGTSPTANGAGGSVVVDNGSAAANKIGITINPPAGGNNIPNTETDKWKIELRNTTVTPAVIDAFCRGGSSHDPKSPLFLNLTTSNTTMTQQSTGTECVSVGAYEVGGQLASFSGRGPTNNTPPRTKPDICAPGVAITSVGLPKDICANCCCECCRDYYVDKDGTSMAAPHITGVIALMLHKNPTLKHTDIKTLLIANFNARPGDAPPADVVGWGAGKVSAKKVVVATTQVNAPVAMVASPEEIRQPILQQFLTTQFGSTYYELGQKYFREILDLINSNKRVATAWHRSKGPVWTRLALTAFHNPELTIPLTVSGLQINESVERFVNMLKKFASKELLTDLERCEPHVSLLHEGMTMTEIMNVLGNQPLPRKEVLYSMT